MSNSVQKAEPECSFEVRSLPATLPGRYLVSGDLSTLNTVAQPALFVGFHGYGENAADHLKAMRAIDAVRSGCAVSVQGLHRFYQRRTGKVVASWMTSEDRQAMISANQAYIDTVVATIEHEIGKAVERVVWIGFSQGVAMAYRAARHCRRAGAVISLGGDIPPEVAEDATLDGASFPAVLLGRGLDDEWYTRAKLDRDVETLTRLEVSHQSLEFEGGHEWTESFIAACQRFIDRILNGTIVS